MHSALRSSDSTPARRLGTVGTGRSSWSVVARRTLSRCPGATPPTRRAPTTHATATATDELDRPRTDGHHSAGGEASPVAGIRRRPPRGRSCSEDEDIARVQLLVDVTEHVGGGGVHVGDRLRRDDDPLAGWFGPGELADLFAERPRVRGSRPRATRNTECHEVGDLPPGHACWGRAGSAGAAVMAELRRSPLPRGRHRRDRPCDPIIPASRSRAGQDRRVRRRGSPRQTGRGGSRRRSCRAVRPARVPDRGTR